jgi:NADPH:quinone reductase-like Zn-dependent oxidoreductase
MQTWICGEITHQKMKEDLGGCLDGMLSEYVVLSEEGLVLLPAHLTYEEGATLPCAAVTAWNALVTQGGLTSGETVLVLGTGGVSVFAIQLAKLHGARVIATSSHEDKLARVSRRSVQMTRLITKWCRIGRREFGN